MRRSRVIVECGAGPKKGETLFSGDAKSVGEFVGLSQGALSQRLSRGPTSYKNFKIRKEDGGVAKVATAVTDDEEKEEMVNQLVDKVIKVLPLKYLIMFIGLLKKKIKEIENE